MTGAIDIRPQDLAIVQAILHAILPPGTRVWVFGSRAKGTARRGSDLDLAIDAGRPLTQDERIDLGEAFEESDLPFTVDVVDWLDMGLEFLKIVERDRVPLPLR